MSDIDDLPQVLARYHEALEAFTRGDSGPLKALYSHADDVCIANPFGPPATGWQAAAETMDRAAMNWRDGRSLGFDRVTDYTTSGLAYLMEIERHEARIGGAVDVAVVTLRVTTILRPEDGTWKIIHRHADPITAARPAASIIQR